VELAVTRMLAVPDSLPGLVLFMRAGPEPGPV